MSTFDTQGDRVSTFDMTSLANTMKRLYGNVGHGRVELSPLEADALLDAMESDGGKRFLEVADEMGAQLGGEYAGSFRLERKDAIITEFNFHVGSKTVVVVATQPRNREQEVPVKPRPVRTLLDSYRWHRAGGFTAIAALRNARGDQ